MDEKPFLISENQELLSEASCHFVSRSAVLSQDCPPDWSPVSPLCPPCGILSSLFLHIYLQYTTQKELLVSTNMTDEHFNSLTTLVNQLRRVKLLS